MGQGVRRAPVATGHRPCRDQRIGDGFLGRLDDRPEQRADPGVDEGRERTRRAAATASSVTVSDRLPVAKHRNRSPLEWAPEPPARAMPRPGPLGHPLALVGQQRRVGGHDDDDRARTRRSPGRRPVARSGSAPPSAGRPRHWALGRRDRPPDRDAADRQPLPAAVVGLDQDAHRPAAVVRGQHPGRRSRCRP